MKPEYNPSKQYEENFVSRLRENNSNKTRKTRLEFVMAELDYYQIVYSYLLSPEEYNKRAQEGIVDFVEIEFSKNISFEIWLNNTERIIAFLQQQKSELEKSILEIDSHFQKSEDEIKAYIETWIACTVGLGDWLSFRAFDVFGALKNRNLTQEEWAKIHEHQNQLYFEAVNNIYNHRLKPRLLKFEKIPKNLQSLLKKELELIQDLFDGNISEPKKDLVLNIFGILDPQNFPAKADKVSLKHYLSSNEHDIHHSDCLSYVEATLRYKAELEVRLKKGKSLEDKDLERISLYFNASPVQLKEIYLLLRNKHIDGNRTSLKDFINILSSRDLRSVTSKIHWIGNLHSLAYFFENISRSIFSNNHYQDQVGKSECFLKKTNGKDEWGVITAQDLARAKNQTKQWDKKNTSLKNILKNIPE